MRNILTTRGLAYRNSVPEEGGASGDLFIEDVNDAPLYSTNPGPHFVFTNKQRVWARQINPEFATGVTKIVNDGSTLWILGIKTEGASTIIETKNNGKTEVLGGFIFPVGSVPAGVPAFINDNSHVSIVALEEKVGSATPHSVVVQERRAGGQWSYLYPSQVPKRSTSNTFVLPLYVGHDYKEYIVDNTDAGFSTVGAWTASTGLPGYYGSNYLHDGSAGADPTKTATWRSPITETATYDVYMRWTTASGAQRPDVAPVEVNYNGGVQRLSVNQTINGGVWVKIGQWSFTGGSGDYVKIEASDDGYTIADAVRWIKVN